MSYFSRLAADFLERDDRSYPSELTLLKLRYTELLERKSELETIGAFSSEFLLSCDDIKTILPEHLSNVRDVDIAIEIVSTKLRTDYGFNITDKHCVIYNELEWKGQYMLIPYGDNELLIAEAA